MSIDAAIGAGLLGSVVGWISVIVYQPCRSTRSRAAAAMFAALFTIGASGLSCLLGGVHAAMVALGGAFAGIAGCLLMRAAIRQRMLAKIT
jgi:hypothetical protein